jgi:hypothetical protein
MAVVAKALEEFGFGGRVGRDIIHSNAILSEQLAKNPMSIRLTRQTERGKKRIS